MILTCYHKDCSLITHVTCLAETLCEETQLVPVSGECPNCKHNLLWGELVRRKQKYDKVNVEMSQPIIQSGVEEESSTVEQQASRMVDNISGNTNENNATQRKRLKRRIKRPNKKHGPHWSEELHVS